MRKTLFFPFLLSLLFISCRSEDLRRDDNPPPVDVTIGQDRLEFSGCSVPSQVGSLICLPGQQASIVTEFDGKVTYFSSGAGCSLRKEVRATKPLTFIDFTSAPPSICTVTVIYLPAYPKNKKSMFPIYSLRGDVTFMPDDKYKPYRSIAITEQELLRVDFPEAISGKFISRQNQTVTDFVGTRLQFSPMHIGQDLIQVKVHYATSDAYWVIPANYYSIRARSVLFQTQGRTVEFDPEVSIVTYSDKIESDNKVYIPKNYTGYVRAYTVAGRTKVLAFSKGVLLWSK